MLSGEASWIKAGILIVIILSLGGILFAIFHPLISAVNFTSSPLLIQAWKTFAPYAFGFVVIYLIIAILRRQSQ